MSTGGIEEGELYAGAEEQLFQEEGEVAHMGPEEAAVQAFLHYTARFGKNVKPGEECLATSASVEEESDAAEAQRVSQPGSKAFIADLVHAKLGATISSGTTSACCSIVDDDDSSDSDEEATCGYCGLPVGAVMYSRTETGERCHGECLAQMMLQDMRQKEQDRLRKDGEQKKVRRTEYEIGWVASRIPRNSGPASRLACQDVPQGMCCLVLDDAGAVRVAAATDPAASVNLEYLSIALEVRMRDGREPYFSLDPVDPRCRETMQVKRFEPEWLAGTSLGEVMFQADYHLKELSMGESEQPVLGMKSCADYLRKGGVHHNWNGREWFTVKNAEVRLTNSNVLVPAVQMGVEAREQVRSSSGGLEDAVMTKPDHPLVKYAQDFTHHFDLIAERKSVVFHLREAAKASVLAKFLLESEVELDDSLFNLAGEAQETCPMEVPMLWNEKLSSKIEVQGGQIVNMAEGVATTMHGVYGGVQFGLDKFSLSAGVAASAALRPAAGRLGTLSAAVATSAALRPGLPLAPKAALQTKILASQAISSTRIAPMAGLLSATGAVRPTPSLSAAMRPAQASMLSSAAIRPQAGLLSTAAVRPAAGLSAAMRPTQATMLSTAAIRPQAGLLSTAAVRPAAGLSAAMRPTQASMLSTAAIRPQAGLLSTAAVRPAAGLSAALRPTQASMLSAAAIRPQAGLLSAVGRPAAAVTAAMRPQRSMLSTAAIRPAGLLSSVARPQGLVSAVSRPQGVDLNLDQFNLTEVTHEDEKDAFADEFQPLEACFNLGDAFWASLSSGAGFRAEDRELLRQVFNPHLSDRREEGELFVPPDASNKYVNRLRKSVDEEKRIRKERLQLFFSKDFSMDAPGQLFPASWTTSLELSTERQDGHKLQERPDYLAHIEAFQPLLRTALPVFDKCTEDGMTFRVYRFGSLELRTTLQHDQDAEVVGMVLSSCPVGKPAGSALARPGERVVKATEFVEAVAMAGKRAMRHRRYTVIETDAQNIIVTELQEDAEAKWEENPQDLQARNSLAKVLRTVECNGAATVRDVKFFFMEKRAAVEGRSRISAALCKRYAKAIFDKATRGIKQ